MRIPRLVITAVLWALGSCAGLAAPSWQTQPATFIPASGSAPWAEVTTAVIGPNKNAACPNGAIVTADGYDIVTTDLTGANPKVWSDNTDPALSKQNPGPQVIYDGQVVATFTGALVFSVEAVSWQPNLTPAPAWSQATAKYNLKLFSYPMGRGVIYIWTSTDCGGSWHFQTPVDFGALPVRDPSPGGDWTTTAPIVGLCGIPRLYSNGTSDAGGPDGHVLYADRLSNDIYISTSCSHGSPTQTYAPDGTAIGALPAGNGGYPDIHVILRSPDNGSSWSVVAESVQGTWRPGISASASDVYVMLSGQNVYALPKPLAPLTNLDALTPMTPPQKVVASKFPVGDPPDLGPMPLFFDSNGAWVSALADGNAFVGFASWCNANQLAWYIDSLAPTALKSGPVWIQAGVAWAPRGPGSVPPPCPGAQALPPSQIYMTMLVEPTYGSGLPPLVTWLQRDNITRNSAGTVSAGSLLIQAATPSEGAFGLAPLYPPSQTSTNRAATWTWNGAAFFGDYFGGAAVHVGDTERFVLAWDENNYLYQGGVVVGPLNDTADGLLAYRNANLSGTVNHVTGDGTVQTDGVLGAGTFASWTRIVGIDNGTRMFFFNAVNGSGAVGHVSGSQVVTEGQQGPGTFGPWTQITAANTNQLFFYNGANGAGAVGHAADNGTIVTDGQQPAGSFATWTQVVGLGDGRVFFYSAANGAAAVQHVTSAGTLSMDSFIAAGTLGAWTNVVSLGGGRLFFYDQKFGAAALAHIASNGTVITDQAFAALTLAPATQVVGYGDGRLLMYNATTGSGEVGYVTDGGKLQLAGWVYIGGGWSLTGY